MQLKVIFGLLVALLIVVFAFQNPGTVNLRFLKWQTGELSLLVVIFGSALGGALMGTLFSMARHWSLKRELKTARLELENLKKTEQP